MLYKRFIKFTVHFVYDYQVCHIVVSMTPDLLSHTTHALTQHLQEIQRLLNLENAVFVGAASDKGAAQRKVI